MNLFDKHTKYQINAERAKENIIPPADMDRIIDDVFDDLARMIKFTIGPAGGNTLVTEPYATTPIFPTKDGFRVMNNHIYDNPAYESIYRIVRDISGRMNEEVGDGTTSGVIIACDFYKRIKKYTKKHTEITPYGIGNLLRISLEEIKKQLTEKGYIHKFNDLSKEQKVSIYKKVATISANNDPEIGEKVAGIYEKSTSEYAYIDIQKSTNSEDHIEVNLGFEMPYGYTHSHMANMADGITAQYDNPLFLLVDGPLLDPDLDNVKNFVRWVTEELDTPRPLVIIAGEYSKKIMDFFTECRTGVVRQIGGGRQVVVKLPILSICFNMMNDMGISRIQDLETILGAKALQTNNGRLQQCPDNPMLLLQMLGRADSIESKYAHTRIRGGGGSEAERKARIEEIKKLIDNMADDAQHGVLAQSRLENLKRRIGMLQGEMHCIHVGGDSFKGKTNRALIYEDATMAVKACIDHGITLGGQVSVSRCINENKSEMIEHIIRVVSDGNNPVNAFIGNNDRLDKIKVISDILDIIAESSKAGFKAVFENASNDKRWIKSVFDKMAKDDVTYNLVKGRFEKFDESVNAVGDTVYPDLIVPGNTDTELLESVFEIVILFVTSNQLISLLPKPDQKR